MLAVLPGTMVGMEHAGYTTRYHGGQGGILLCTTGYHGGYTPLLPICLPPPPGYTTVYIRPPPVRASAPSHAEVLGDELPGSRRRYLLGEKLSPS